jgi:tetratricopeptide (TPR) repeat protein
MTAARRALVLIGLFLITAAAYSPAWHGGVLWDDEAHLTARALQNVDGLGRIWFDVGATQQYYPVVHSAFWIMNALWGSSMLGYHLVTIGLHALAAWLVGLVLQRLRIPGAWLTAVIFALHPVHVESVAWITELKNTLSAVWYLLAALAYLRFDVNRQARWYAIAIGLFALALLGKSVTATLPVALLIVFWWQRGRIDWRRDVRPLVPFVLLGLAAGLMTAWVERTFIGATGSDFQLSLVERCLLAGRAILFYLSKLVWPVNLIFIYPRWTISQAALGQYLFPVAVLAMTVLLWRYRTRSRAPLAAWLFFIATLGPALGFVNVYPFRYSYVADHFQYLASLGIITLAAAAIANALERRRTWTPRRALAIAAIVAVPLAVLTWRQSRQYVNAAALYQTTLARNPQCWMAHNNLAALALAESPPALDVALTHVRASLQLNPRNDVAHNNLGLVHQKQGEFAQAIRAHEEAIRLNPRYADAYINLGVDLAAEGRTDDAIARYREAVRLAPYSAGARYNLGRLLSAAGRGEEGLAEIREAIRLDPEFADAHDALGSALQRVGRVDDAIAAYREAARLAPTSGAVQNNLGAALVSAGRIEEAATALREAARLLPDSGLAHDNLGRVLLMMGRHDEAAAEFQTAVRVAPTFGLAHEHHAKMLQDAGRLPEAIAEYELALKYTPDSAEAHNNLGVALAMSGRVSDATPHFAEAVRLRPDFAEARANLARARGRNRP